MPTDLPTAKAQAEKKQNIAYTVGVLMAPVVTLLTTICIVSFTVFCWHVAFDFLGWWLPEDITSTWTQMTFSLPIWGMILAFTQIGINILLTAAKILKK